MKRVSSLFLAAMLLVGCSKKEDSQSAATYYMSAKIGNVAFSTNEVTLGGDGTFLSVDGSNGKDAILLYIDNYHGKGTYRVGTDWIVPTQLRVNSKAKYAVHGFATITATSPNMTGTFYFTCEDSTKITAGSFSVANN